MLKNYLNIKIKNTIESINVKEILGHLSMIIVFWIIFRVEFGGSIDPVLGIFLVTPVILVLIVLLLVSSAFLNWKYPIIWVLVALLLACFEVSGLHDYITRPALYGGEIVVRDNGYFRRYTDRSGEFVREKKSAEEDRRDNSTCPYCNPIEYIPLHEGSRYRILKIWNNMYSGGLHISTEFGDISGGDFGNFYFTKQLCRTFYGAMKDLFMLNKQAYVRPVERGCTR